MDMRTYAVHAPALSLPEAAMMPALPKPWQGTPRNLLIPSAHLDYRQGAVDGGGTSVDNFSAHRGSMAGRAILTYVQNGPNRWRR